jgi:predicted RNA-binding protein associated with RNAse of E/G family
MIWRENRRLTLWRPHRRHAVSLFWRDADDTFLCWYVDILLPFRRTLLGFDTRDLTLDVVMNPDRTWRLKDEDELEWAVEQGTIGRGEAEQIRAEAGRAIALFEGGDSLYSEEWIPWRPNPEWPLPSLPDGWNDAVF